VDIDLQEAGAQAMKPNQFLTSGWRICGIVAASALLGGCSSKGEPQVWTTKGDSGLAAKSDLPEPNVGQSLPVVDADDLRASAISLLLRASESTNPLLRTNAIEALHDAPDQLESVIQRTLGDSNRAVRFVSAMTVGQLKLQNLVPLVEPLLHDESQSVQAAAIYAMRRCGRKADLNPLAAMLAGEDPEVKGNAALVLGELGDPSAIPMLRDAVGRGLRRTAPARKKIVELQLAESMVKLGALNQVDVIRAALFAPSEEGEFAALACQMCGRLKDGGALPDLHNIVRRSGRFERPAEVRMAAALAIAEIDPARAIFDVPFQYAASSRYELRQQAAHTLAGIGAAAQATGQPNEQVMPTLAILLNDENPLVQVSAAGGVLRMQPQAVVRASR
jgi:HEAT repeat protein